MSNLRGGDTIGGYPIPGMLGTNGKIAKFNGLILTDSLISDDGATVTVNGFGIFTRTISHSNTAGEAKFFGRQLGTSYGDANSKNAVFTAVTDSVVGDSNWLFAGYRDWTNASPTIAFAINGNGQTGINTSPGSISGGSNVSLYHLDVNGSIRVRTGSTETDLWPVIAWGRDEGGSTWDDGLIKGGNTRHINNKSGFGIHFKSDKAFSFFSTGWTRNWTIEHGGHVNQTGGLTIGGSVKLKTNAGTIASNADFTNTSLEVRNNGGAGEAAFITFHRGGAHAFHFGMDTDNQLKVGGYSMGANSYKVWHGGNDGSASGLDADLLDGIQGSGYGRAYSGDHSFGGAQTAISTADFVTMLNSLGAFNQPYWIARGSWSYAANQYISDTGIGNIHLAGCTVEVMGDSVEYTIRIHTPTTSASGVTNTEFIYVNNGSTYSPGWRKIWNSANDGSGSGLDADLVRGVNILAQNQATHGNAVGLSEALKWKHYGNGHTIIDASASTAPNGVAINNTNSATAWTPQYPTLMGWNGSSTYGVRVDSSRLADGVRTFSGSDPSSQPVGAMWIRSDL